MSKYSELLRRPARPVVLTVRDLLQAAASYFAWAEDYPLTEEKVHFSKEGHVSRADLAKARPFTLKGFAAYTGLREADLKAFRDYGDDWAAALDRVEEIIYTQQYEHAAAGLMNSTLISRALGLADKQEVETATTIIQISSSDADL